MPLDAARRPRGVWGVRRAMVATTFPDDAFGRRPAGHGIALPPHGDEPRIASYRLKAEAMLGALAA